MPKSGALMVFTNLCIQLEPNRTPNALDERKTLLMSKDDQKVKGQQDCYVQDMQYIEG
jgi:hypothetical protein